MAWHCHLFDTITGQLAQPIDVPNVSWSVSVSDSSLSTTRDKGTGEGELNSLTLPWSAIPGADKYEKHNAVASWRRGLVMDWDGVPVVAGLIGERTDSWLDTSFSLVSIPTLLGSRYIVNEGTFGNGGGGKTTSKVSFKGLSYRAIACGLVQVATQYKPGGTLPIVLPYLGERGSHERNYTGYNVANNDCAKLLKELANCQGGPDIQFRPEFTAEGNVQWSLLAGSDAEPLFLGTSPVPVLTAHPGGGTAESVKVAHQGAVHRVYQTGAGTDEATLCYLAEDLEMCERADPYPLMETTNNESDDERLDLVKSHAAARLELLGFPVCQVTCTVDAGDHRNPVRPGLVWPGEPVALDIYDHPALPDGRHYLRLMEMKGDLGNTLTLTFDVMADPLESTSG